MPVAKKERPNHKCWWQTKNGCPNQSSKQLIPNERNKTAESISKPQTVAYLQALYNVEKKHTHTHTIFYRLQFVPNMSTPTYEDMKPHIITQNTTKSQTV